MKSKKIAGKIVYHLLVGIGAFIMVYPLLWMVMSSFKETNTIFTTAGQLIPKQLTLENYQNGWRGFGKVSFGTFFKNSFFIAALATFGTILSSAFVAYSFSRCRFWGKKLLFAAMLVSMMLPAQVLMIPPVLMVSEAGLGWDVSSSDCPLLLCYSGIFRISDHELYKWNPHRA